MAKVSESPLTAREREVLLYMSRSFSVERMAEILQITPATVRTHQKHITKKLGGNRMTAVATALRNGWIK